MNGLIVCPGPDVQGMPPSTEEQGSPLRQTTIVGANASTHSPPSHISKYVPPTIHVGPALDNRAAKQGHDVEGGDFEALAGAIASRKNGVVRLRNGFNPTSHEYLSISCLL